MAIHSKLRTLDLFSGIGGISIGLQRWCKTVCYCEIDPYACGVLIKNMAKGTLDVAPIWSDIKAFGQSEIDHVGPIECITGGDPCQANSKAAISGSGAESLGGEFIRLVQKIRPIVVLRENPIPRKNAPWPWWRFISELELLGYFAIPARIRACCVGADHQRERMFVCAVLPNAVRQGLPVGSQAGTNPQNEINKQARPGPAKPFALPRIECCGLDFWGGKVHGIPFRAHRLKCLGNAVVPQCAEKAFEMLLREII
ncbi:MAG: DNA cytosine methyltransferase [Desulfobacteraceae bacterium]|nr:DNA cytosine methyltransferase [Desulfobacteraceae bacterium]